MAKKKKTLEANETYIYAFANDIRLMKDPVKKIIYPTIKHWINHNCENEKIFYFKEGYYWTKGTHSDWANQCYLEAKTVGTHLRELVISGILKEGKFNFHPSDQTKWYRLATEVELENVDFRMLHYGNANTKKSEMHDNKTLFAMYQNGTIGCKKTESLDENLGHSYIEHNKEYIKEDNKEEYLKQTSEYTKEDNFNLFEEYELLSDDKNIFNHLDFFSKIKIEEFPIDKLKFFLDKFHEKEIDTIQNAGDMYYYSCLIEGKYEKDLNKNQIDLFKKIATFYYNSVISPQPAEHSDNERNSTNSSTQQIST